jgi:hypothetical protein
MPGQDFAWRSICEFALGGFCEKDRKLLIQET